MAKKKPAVLLLGCSRFRFLYHSAVKQHCDADPYNWAWTLPSPVVGFGSAHGTYSRSETAAGAICSLPNATFSALGLFQHFGLAEGAADVFSKGGEAHFHDNWDGHQMGLLDASSTIRRADEGSMGERNAASRREFGRLLRRVPPRRLILQAIQRFVYRAPAGAPIVVVLSSATWDVARHHERFRQQSLEAWAAQYRANLSSVVRSVVAAADVPFTLALATDYPTTDSFLRSVKPRVPVNDSRAMLQRAAEVMREIASEHGLAVFDQARAVEMMVRGEGHSARARAEAVFVSSAVAQGGKGGLPPRMAWSVAIRPGDGVHPTPAACAWLWLKLVQFVGELVERGSASWVGAEALGGATGTEPSSA
eukprot:scaffold4035_cov132-Isochrysis_galbana.AAC.5